MASPASPLPARRPSRIFISYRRNDDPAFTHRLYSELVQYFGRDDVMQDVDSIPMGTDFREYIRQAITACQVVLIVIGRGWEERRDGELRLASPTDHVRVEIEEALRLRPKLLVLPVYVGTTPQLVTENLPASLHDLPFINAHRIDPGRDFGVHLRRLLSEIERTLYVRRVMGTLGRLRRRLVRGRWQVAFGGACAVISVLAALVGYLAVNTPNMARVSQALQAEDAENFAAGWENTSEIVRAVPSRAALEADRKLAEILDGTQATFDFFADQGAVLTLMRDPIDAMMRRGVRIRVVLVDNSSEASPNVQLRARFPNPAELNLTTEAYLRRGAAARDQIAVLQDSYARSPRVYTGRMEVRYLPHVFVNSIWLRDAALPANALGHIQVTLYGDNRQYPIIRFGRLSPTMIGVLAREFEYIWSLARE